MRRVIVLTCRHDGEAGVLASGKPRCPMCRREAEHKRLDDELRRVVEADWAARAAADDTLWEDE